MKSFYKGSNFALIKNEFIRMICTKYLGDCSSHSTDFKYDVPT